MNVLPLKFDNLFSKITQNEGFYELNIELDQIDLALDLLRLDKDYQEYLFTSLFKDYLNKNSNHLRPEPSVQFKNFIYRGQKDYEWKLEPGSLRDYTKHKSSYAEFELESILNFMNCTDELNIQLPADSFDLREMINNLLSQKGLSASNNWITKEFYEIIGYAQHYGATTRLLDWSYNPLVALYFASVGLLTTEKHPDYFSLFIFNTDYLKIKNPDINLVDVINIPKGLNKHISYQRGCFTLTNQTPYRNTPRSIEIREYLGVNCETKPVLIPEILKTNEQDYCLLKINFPAKSANQVFKYCNSMGFNASNIYEPGEALKKRIIEMKFL